MGGPGEGGNLGGIDRLASGADSVCLTAPVPRGWPTPYAGDRPVRHFYFPVCHLEENFAVSRLHESLPALFRINRLQIFGTSITSLVVGLSLTALGILGCAPRGGTAARDDVVEIETIEVAAPPPAAEPVADTGAAARQAIDEEKAAADKAIDEAGKSIEPPAEPAADEPAETPLGEEPVAGDPEPRAQPPADEPAPADAPAPADL